VTKLYDVVNFNSDASCLDAKAWLAALEGGEQSHLCKWLMLYIEYNKPVGIGFTGATLADIHTFNSEALLLLRKNPEIFQIIWRPFAHDLPFFRTDEGFRLNLTLGRLAAQHLIGRVSPIYLPPEFMQTNRQTALLAQNGAEATFIFAGRFKNEIKMMLPESPFLLKGIPDGILECIPVTSDLTKAYLSSIQLLDKSIWQNALANLSSAVVWRDGESSFLLPDGLERERFWLEVSGESREHIKVSEINELDSLQGYSYPVHPFSAWMNEMSMFWFVQRIRDLEQRVISTNSAITIARWLNCINSDILSAVEKRSPVVQLRGLRNDIVENYRIKRSDRAFEGEALLEMAEKNYDVKGDAIWQKRALAREQLVCNLLR